MRAFVFSSAASILCYAPIANAREPVEISYFLPKARVTASIDQTITECPPSAEDQASEKGNSKLRFSYFAAIAAKMVPDRLVMLDASSAALVDRATTITFTEDGLLKTFNSKSTGQGGPLLVSLLKAGAVAASVAAGPLPAAVTAATVTASAAGGLKSAQRTRTVTGYFLQCTTAAHQLLQNYKKIEADIAALEDLILKGGVGIAQQSLLTDKRAELVAAKAKLTQRSKPSAPLVPKLKDDGSVIDTEILMPEADFAQWLEVVPVSRKIDEADPYVEQSMPTLTQAIIALEGDVVPGQFGYVLNIKIDSQQQKWFSCSTATTPCSKSDADDSTISGRDLVYRRPILAAASLAPLHAACPSFPCAPAPKGWTAAAQASANENVKLSQLSRLFRTPTGGGSIFGSRTVTAEFGTSGEPLSLGYERGSSAKDIATVIDAGASAATTIDGAELAATKTQIERLEAQKKLAELEKELDAPE